MPKTKRLLGKQAVNNPGLANNSEKNVRESELALVSQKRTLSAEDIFSNLFKKERKRYKGGKNKWHNLKVAALFQILDLMLL